VILFLREGDDASLRLLGGARGVFRVGVDEETGAKVVEPGTETAAVALKQDARKVQQKRIAEAGEKGLSKEALTAPVTLEEYMNHLRDIAREQRREKR